MNERSDNSTADIYQEGATPVQAFTTSVVEVAPGDALKRRGRPSRPVPGKKVESDNANGPTQEEDGSR
jgi:hypothetical protein